MRFELAQVRQVEHVESTYLHELLHARVAEELVEEAQLRRPRELRPPPHHSACFALPSLFALS